MDEELTPLYVEKEFDGKVKKFIPRDKIFSWLQMKGAIRFQTNSGIQVPVVLLKFENGKLLYELLLEEFNVYINWKSKGKKLTDIGDLGLENDDEPTERRGDKESKESGADIPSDFGDDIPFGREGEADM